MPLYVYRCEACGTSFEVLVQRREQQTVSPCPQCGASTVRKQFAAFATVGRETSTWASDAGPSCGLGGCCCTPND
ncbi:MAG: zinc ribbon domain-containing protein [Thermorudis peleae]|nr:zinc ribbon domain-containing protein [Thermorudis peleae]